MLVLLISLIHSEIQTLVVNRLDTNKETALKEDEIVKFTPHLADVYKIKDGNFNKWDLVPKIKIVINKKDVLKITDYDEAYYYGYFNDDTVKIPKDVYKLSNKYCEEGNDGQEQNNG